MAYVAPALTRLDTWLSAHPSRECIIQRDHRRGVSYWEIWLGGRKREVLLTEVELMTALERPGLTRLIQAALAEAERKGL